MTPRIGGGGGGVASPVVASTGHATRARPVRLPHGVRDYLPEAEARRRGITEALLGEFERWGYRRIVTPAFEYEEVLARGLGPGAQAQAVRFVEPGSGEVVMLRPDITPQVARLVATRLASEPGPIRLAYEGAVTRLSLSPSALAGQRELFQAGIELADAPSPEGDVEVIGLAGAALSAAGVRRYTLDLGEASVARAALAGLAEGDVIALKAAIGRKDLDDVGRLARGLDLPRARRRLLEALPGLYGGVEVIDRAASLLSRDQESGRAGLAALSEVVAGLSSREPEGRLSIDLGEVRGFDYYTGVRFQGYAPGVGDALLSGGRYDHLIERYGAAATAAGFAVDVDRVGLALEAETGAPEPASPGLYLCGEPAARHALARALRHAGVCVAEELEHPVPVDALLRERARHAGCGRVVVLDGAGARWLDGGGAEGRVSARALSSLRARGEPLAAILPARYLEPPRRGELRHGGR